MRNLKAAILVPCYRRPEYTERCLAELAKNTPKADVYLFNDGDIGENDRICQEYSVNSNVNYFRSVENKGLRSVIIEFFGEVVGKYDVLAKVDNDCMVPEKWLERLLGVLYASDVDILSPSVFPSEAELRFGKNDKEQNGYLPTRVIGGLWCMKAKVIEGIEFEDHNLRGMVGAIALLRQIQLEKEPKVGWVQDVVFQDIGHWSGKHPDHIKSLDHLDYSRQVDRKVAWQANKEALCP